MGGVASSALRSRGTSPLVSLQVPSGGAHRAPSLVSLKVPGGGVALDSHETLSGMTSTIPVTSFPMDGEHPPIPDEVWQALPVGVATKPAPNYPRRIYWSVNLILLVLVPILAILGFGALRDVKADRADREHAEYCQTMEEIFEQVPSDCP